MLVEGFVVVDDDDVDLRFFIMMIMMMKIITIYNVYGNDSNECE